MAPKPKEKKVLCAACKREAVVDFNWPTLCRFCAAKIRAADIRASSTKGIRDSMRDEDLL